MVHLGYRLKILLKPSVFILGLHQQIHNVFTTITSMGSKKKPLLIVLSLIST